MCDGCGADRCWRAGVFRRRRQCREAETLDCAAAPLHTNTADHMVWPLKDASTARLSLFSGDQNSISSSEEAPLFSDINALSLLLTLRRYRASSSTFYRDRETRARHSRTETGLVMTRMLTRRHVGHTHLFTDVQVSFVSVVILSCSRRNDQLKLKQMEGDLSRERHGDDILQQFAPTVSGSAL